MKALLEFAALFVGLGVSSFALADEVECFNGCPKSLEAHKCYAGADRDYSVTTMEPNAEVTVLAIHGRMEENTSELAKDLATLAQWNLYAFDGHGKAGCLQGRRNSEVLSISASKFNDPTATQMLARHTSSVAIGGYSETRDYKPGVICAGGGNHLQIETFVEAIQDAIQAKKEANDPNWANYPIEAVDATAAAVGSDCARFRGTDPNNIVNLNASGHGGLQLYFSKKMREDLMSMTEDTATLRDTVYASIWKAMQTEHPEYGMQVKGLFTGSARLMQNVQWFQKNRWLLGFIQTLNNEKRALDLINAERRSHGMSPLSANGGARTAAYNHSALVCKLRQMSHQLPGEPDVRQRLQNAGAPVGPYASVAENVAIGTQNAEGAVNWWVNSPAHHNNMIGSFSSVGVTYVNCPAGVRVADGTNYPGQVWTSVFY